jgi:WD40 repeat protein
MADASAFEKASLAWTLPWQDDWVTAVTFVGPKRRVAAGNNLGQILLWDLPEKPSEPAPPPVRRLDGHTNVISRLLASPDGRWLISASYDHSVRLWDMEAAATGTAEVILDSRSRADAARRAGAKAPPPAPGVKVELQQAAKTLDGHTDWVMSLAMTPDGKMLVSGDEDSQVIVWDLPAQKELRRWKVNTWVYALALSADGKQLLVSERLRRVFSTDARRAVKLWDPNTGQMIRDLTAAFTQEIGSAAFSPDGKLLVLGQGGESDGQNKLFVLEAASGKKLREIPSHLNGVTDVAFTADGKYLLSSGRDTLVRVWDPSDGKKVAEIGKSRGGQFKDWIHAFALAADQRWLAAADMAGQVVVYSL